MCLYTHILIKIRQRNGQFIIKTCMRFWPYIRHSSVNAYKVRQFNSQNVPVKAEFAYLCNSGCCRLRNTLLVELGTS
jgi:hypothetical protein